MRSLGTGERERVFHNEIQETLKVYSTMKILSSPGMVADIHNILLTQMDTQQI